MGGYGMTRENEITAEADCSYEGNYKSLQKLCFIDGAKWADKTMIEKASRWLESNTNPVFYSGNGWTTEEFIDNFKKAMEL